jgi:ureidoglycolate dehydrogenase (NAD+)
MKMIPVAELTRFVVEVLEHYGVSGEDAKTTADVLVTTDSWGIGTHGTKLLGLYAKRLKAGGLKAKGRPRVSREGLSWAGVDADQAIGMVGSVFAMKTAMSKASQTGIAIVTVHNSCHFGAAGYYAFLAAQQGMIGLAMANDTPTVAAPGSKGPVFGTNPIAFGAPGGSHAPVVLDMATAVVAGGKITQALAAGRPIPEGWMVDLEGRSTTDGRLFAHSASLLPLAGFKGYGLAAMIEILSGVLSGSALRDKVGLWGHDLVKPSHHGHAFIAIDPILIAGQAFHRRMDELIDGVKASPVVGGLDPLCMPGENEHNERVAALTSGISLGDDVVKSLRVIAAEASLPFPFSLAESD